MTANRFICLLPIFAVAMCASAASAVEAKLIRAINLNGPPLTIGGRSFEGKDAADLRVSAKAFENQSVPLKPPTDAARARMIRSSVWGDGLKVEVSGLPVGTQRVVLYVWEDNNSEQFDVLLNGSVVAAGFRSGSAGMWKKLGPWKCDVGQGKITITTRGGAANLSGVEVWSGDGDIPDEAHGEFVATPTAEQVAFFESKIRPLLADRCYECHSAQAKKVKGGLVLDSRVGVQKGGDSGPAVAPGDLDSSLLIAAVRHTDLDLAMPPKKKLLPEEIAALEGWVKMGAPDPRTEDTHSAVKAKTAIDWTKAREWWSLRPLASPPVPPVKNPAWPANEIDHFILAKIEAAALAPTGDADRRALIRRMTFDLIGLPPAPEEVDAFVSASIRDPQAATRDLIERLLASPRYGERWGRYWLDVVRYADTAGDNSDFPIPQMHRYRDWVIAAFNRDLPYDEFVRQQIAGDLLPNATPESIIATGYIANSRRFGSRVDDYPQHLTIEDTIDNVGRAFLGLTVNCARCHDHKFDPITAQDYYGLYGIFHSTRYPWPGIELEQKQRDLVALASDEAVATFQKEKAAKQKPLNDEVKRLENAMKDAKGEAKKALEEELKQAKEAAGKNERMPPPYELVYAVADAAKREDAPLQFKGDPAKTGPLVPRRFLTVLGGDPLPPGDASSGRRQLAEWIVAQNNPLTARVMVNRIWLNHFGKGLVPTPNDFGKQGKPPTHPELLDWLAARFVQDGWSIKKMHRLILSSRTYQLASARPLEAIEKDANNDSLSSFPRRRLDAESIRDTLLSLGENLDLSPAGAHPFPPQTEWKFTQHHPFKAVYETNRRSVFLMTQRIQRHPYLAIFDGADPSVSTPQRSASTTPLQALYLLNDPFVHEQAKRIAERISRAGPDDPTRIQAAYALLFARPAADDELAAAQKFLTTEREKLRGEKPAWQAYTRVLLRLNEFVYPD